LSKLELLSGMAAVSFSFSSTPRTLIIIFYGILLLK
jgi:hypothetical protein